MANKINKVTPEVIQKMKQKSALGLPDRPSESRLNPAQIKKAFADFVTGGSISAIVEIDRIAEEITTILGKLFEGVYTTLPTDLSNFENNDKIILTDGSIYKFDLANNQFIKTNLNKTDIEQIETDLETLITTNATNIATLNTDLATTKTNLTNEITRSTNKDNLLSDTINTVNADLQSTKTGRLKTAEDKITALEGNTVKNTGKTSQNVDGKVIVDSLETDIIDKKTKDTTPILVNEKLKYNTDIDSLSNDTTLATTKFVRDRVADLLNQLAGGELDEALDTLKELQTALNNDPNFASTVATELGKKVDKTTTINAKPLNANIVLDKTDIGLPNVIDIKQASKVEHDELVSVVNQKVNTTDLNPVFSIDIDRLWFVNEPGPNWQYATSELVQGLHYFADNAGYNYPLWVGIKSIYQGDAGVAIECYYANNRIFEDENVLTEITPNTNDIYYVIDGDDFAGKYIKWDGTNFYESSINKTLSLTDFPNTETPITDFEGYAILHGNNNAEIYLHRLNEPEAEINKTAVYYGIVRDRVGNPAFSGYKQIAYKDYVDNLVSTLETNLTNDITGLNTKTDNIIKGDQIVGKAEIAYSLESADKKEVKDVFVNRTTAKELNEVKHVGVADVFEVGGQTVKQIANANDTTVNLVKGNVYFIVSNVATSIAKDTQTVNLVNGYALFTAGLNGDYTIDIADEKIQVFDITAMGLGVKTDIELYSMLATTFYSFGLTNVTPTKLISTGDNWLKPLVTKHIVIGGLGYKYIGATNITTTFYDAYDNVISTTTDLTFTAPNNCIYITIDTTDTNVALYHGSNGNSKYLPYTEDITPIPEFIGRSLPNGVRNTPEWNNVGKVVSKGSEAWHLYKRKDIHLFLYTNTYIDIYIDTDPHEDKRLLSDRLPNKSFSTLNNGDEIGISLNHLNSRFYISIPKTWLSDYNDNWDNNQVTNALKSWLQANNLEIYYQLAEPTPTNIPAWDKQYVAYNYGRESLDKLGYVNCLYYKDVVKQNDTNTDVIADLRTSVQTLEGTVADLLARVQALENK